MVLLDHRGQRFAPVGVQLLIGQLLRAYHIIDPSKAVVRPVVADLGRVELPTQPLATVQAHLDEEREPSLQSQVH
jgi:hypothetical protein